MDYADCLEMAHTRKRKLANNTYLQIEENETFSIRLYLTDIIRYFPNGDIELNSGGWQTVTTKDRFRRFLPRDVSVYSENGVWHVLTSFDYFVFEDGIMVHPDGTVSLPCSVHA
jgi:hypothetical protein